MRSVLVLAVFGCVFAFAQASALKSLPQELQGWSCDVGTIGNLYGDIWNGTFALKSDIVDNVLAASDGVWDCLRYALNIEKVWDCGVAVVQEQVDITYQEVQEYLSTTRGLCDQLTAELKNCVTL